MSNIPICVACGEPYARARARLGYKVCPDCGEVEAQRKALEKSKRLAPLYNKGAYQYITDGDSLRSLGRKI